MVKIYNVLFSNLLYTKHTTYTKHTQKLHTNYTQTQTNRQKLIKNIAAFGAKYNMIFPL